MASGIGNLPLEQPVTWRLERTGASSYQRTWFGTRQQLELIASVERTFAESMEFRGGHGLCELTATYSAVNPTTGTPDEPDETQELETEFLQQSIFLNETFAPLADREIALVRQVFENNESYEDALTVFQAPLVITNGLISAGGIRDGSSFGFYYRLAVDAYNLLLQGSEAFEVPTFVLSRQRTVSRRYPGKLDLTQIGTVWTTAQLVAYAANPLLFDVPSLTITGEETLKHLRAGWRQTVCRVVDVADGSRTMHEQWKLAKWSTDLYRAKS